MNPRPTHSHVNQPDEPPSMQNDPHGPDMSSSYPGTQRCTTNNPPSNYMMHFKMVSTSVAKQPLAKVNECYRRHQTTARNDIRGVGWYKYH